MNPVSFKPTSQQLLLKCVGAAQENFCFVLIAGMGLHNNQSPTFAPLQCNWGARWTLYQSAVLMAECAKNMQHEGKVIPLSTARNS
jgi:hypothetical protein